MFRHRGYSGTTMRDLATELGLTSGSIFHYFGSKEEVLLQVVEDGVNHAIGLIRAAQEESDAGLPMIRAMMEAHLESIVGDYPQGSSVLFHEQWELSKEAQDRLSELRDRYEVLWDEALASLGGTYADSDTRRMRRLLLLGAMNWASQWYKASGPYGLDRISDELMEFFPDPQG